MQYSLRYTTTLSTSADGGMATKQQSMPRRPRRQTLTGAQVSTNVANCVNRNAATMEKSVATNVVRYENVGRLKTDHFGSNEQGFLKLHS